MDDVEVTLTLEAQGDGGQVVAVNDAGDELAFGLHTGTLLRHVEGDRLVQHIRPGIHRFLRGLLMAVLQGVTGSLEAFTNIEHVDVKQQVVDHGQLNLISTAIEGLQQRVETLP